MIYFTLGLWSLAVQYFKTLYQPKFRDGTPLVKYSSLSHQLQEEDQTKFDFSLAVIKIHYFGRQIYKSSAKQILLKLL